MSSAHSTRLTAHQLRTSFYDKAMASDNVDNNRKVSPEELAKHATAKDCWLLSDGIVYDVTKYLDNHPGGSAVMVEHAGQDCTSNFEDIGMQPLLC